jgi:hypothetical protein
MRQGLNKFLKVANTGKTNEQITSTQSKQSCNLSVRGDVRACIICLKQENKSNIWMRKEDLRPTQRHKQLVKFAVKVLS